MCSTIPLPNAAVPAPIQGCHARLIVRVLVPERLIGAVLEMPSLLRSLASYDRFESEPMTRDRVTTKNLPLVDHAPLTIPQSEVPGVASEIVVGVPPSRFARPTRSSVRKAKTGA